MAKMTQLRALVLLEKIQASPDRTSWALDSDELLEVAKVHDRLMLKRPVRHMHMGYADVLANVAGVSRDTAPETLRLYIAAIRAAGKEVLDEEVESP